MSAEAFRAAVNTAIVDWIAGHPTVNAFYENGPTPDLARVSEVWVDSDIRFYNASTVAMGERPRGRATGAVMVRVYAREGSGTQLQAQLVDELEELFRPKHLGGGVLHFPERMTPVPAMGWHKLGILAPFHLDRV